MVQRAKNKSLRRINFKEERHPCDSLFNEAKKLDLPNMIALNHCMLVFDHLSSSLPAIFDHLFKHFKEQRSHNPRGARRYCLAPFTEHL